MLIPFCRVEPVWYDVTVIDLYNRIFFVILITRLLLAFRIHIASICVVMCKILELNFAAGGALWSNHGEFFGTTLKCYPSTRTLIRYASLKLEFVDSAT